MVPEEKIINVNISIMKKDFIYMVLNIKILYSWIITLKFSKFHVKTDLTENSNL
jgi:hypothetical protein